MVEVVFDEEGVSHSASSFHEASLMGIGIRIDRAVSVVEGKI